MGSTPLSGAKSKNGSFLSGIIGCSTGRFQKNQLKNTLKGNHYGLVSQVCDRKIFTLFKSIKIFIKSLIQTCEQKTPLYVFAQTTRYRSRICTHLLSQTLMMCVFDILQELWVSDICLIIKNFNFHFFKF